MMELNHALQVAKLWAAGKTIGFDESDVLNALINSIEGKSMLTPEDSKRVADRMIQAIGIALLEGKTPDKPSGYMLEDALHYLERRRVHLATKVLGNTDVPYTSRVKCGLEREAILMAESAVKAEIGCEMVRSMRDVV